MAHDGFGHAAQCPALYAGAPVGAHGDQVVRNLLRQRNDLIGVKTLLDNGRDFFEATAWSAFAFSSRYALASSGE